MKSVSLAAERANHILGSTKQSITSGLKDMIILLYSVFAKLHLDSCVQFWTSQFKKGVKVLRCVQRRIRKLGKGLERMYYEKWLRTLSSQEKRRLRGVTLLLSAIS